jgi:hypothetical protein
MSGEMAWSFLFDPKKGLLIVFKFFWASLFPHWNEHIVCLPVKANTSGFICIVSGFFVNQVTGFILATYP